MSTTDDELDYTPAPREQSAQFSRWMLARLHGDEFQHYTDRGPGECAECKHERFARFTYGTFALCFECLNRRLRAASKLNAPLEHIAQQPDTALHAQADAA